MSEKPEHDTAAERGEMTEDELDGAAGGNPIGGVIGAVAGVTGLSGLGEKVGDIIQAGGDMVEDAVTGTSSQIMSKRKGG